MARGSRTPDGLVCTRNGRTVRCGPNTAHGTSGRYLPLDFACDNALAAMLRVRADDRPSLSAFDALLATDLLVTRLDELLPMDPYLLPRPCVM